MTLEQLFRLVRIAHNIHPSDHVMVLISDPQGQPPPHGPPYAHQQWRVSFRLRLEGEKPLADAQDVELPNVFDQLIATLRQTLLADAERHTAQATSSRTRLEQFEQVLAASRRGHPFAPTEPAPPDSVPPSSEANDQ